jgi:hypothetical protein
MTLNHIDPSSHPSKMDDPAVEPVHAATVYVLLAICYVLIAITMYIIWQKAETG